MGHHITAIIGGPVPVARIAEAAHCPPPTSLQFGFHIVPLGHAQIDALANDQLGTCFEGFNYLSPNVVDAILRAIGGGMVAYIETDYFGGAGSQSAAVFRDGSVVMRAAIPVNQDPARDTGPINAALKAIGLEAVIGQDEFDTLGLSRFRNLESLGMNDWEED